LCLQGQGGQCGDIGDRSVDVQALRHHAVAQVTVGHQAEQMALLHQQYGRDAQVAHLLCRGADGGLGCQGDGLALDECAYRGAQQVQVHPRVGRSGWTGLPRSRKRGKKISQCAMLAAQGGDSFRVQPGNVAIGCGGGLPGGQVLCGCGAKAEHVTGLQVDRHVQVGVVQIHRTAQNQSGAAVQAALRQQRAAYIGLRLLPPGRQRGQGGRVELAPDAMPGQCLQDGGRGLLFWVHGNAAPVVMKTPIVAAVGRFRAWG